jgi:hypothetical protein
VQLSDKPVWSPTFRSLESLFEEITGLTQADNLSLIFDLFQAFKQHKPTNESFDDFYFWGEMLLDDFDDLDKHLVDARDLFRNVSDLKEIDLLFDYLTDEQKDAIRVFWQDFNGGKGGSLKTDFASIWSLLYPVYETFRQRLKEKSLGYGGMIQREAISVIARREANVIARREANVPYEKYVFIGFNALTNCESYFFKSLQKQGRAVFFWDYDDYYIANHWHEAGMFMRENIVNFPSEWHFDTKNLDSPSKHIEIISVPSETGQAKLAGQLLASLQEDIIAIKQREIMQPCRFGRPESISVDRNDTGATEEDTGLLRSARNDAEFACNDASRTAVVLPDEHLLLPMLSSIPDAVSDVNITMGYPFTCSPAYSLFERLVSLQHHVRNYADGPRFFHTDVCMLLNHPYIQEIIPEEGNAIIKSIIEYNRIYVEAPLSRPAGENEHGAELLQLLFRKCTQAREFSEYLPAIVSKIVAFHVQSSKFKVQSSKFKVQSSKFKV